MIDLKSAPSEGASLNEAIRYLAYLREQIQYLEDLREKQMAQSVAEMATATAAKEE